MFIEEYTLPELTANAGETTIFQINVHDPDDTILLATDMTCNVYEYCNLGTPVLELSGDVTGDSSSHSGSFIISLNGSDTISLHGKYIYQVTLSGDDGNLFARKGILYFAYNPDSAGVSA